MFTTERFFANIVAGWFLIVMISLLMVGSGPSGMVYPATAVVVAMTSWSVHCAYRTQHFITYAGHQLLFNLAFAPLFASLLILAIAYKVSKLSPSTSLFFASLPVGLVVLLYLAIYTLGSAGKNSSLRFEGKRVESVERPLQTKGWHGGFAAVIGGMCYPILKEHDATPSGLVCFFIAISAFLVFYHRYNILAYKQLKILEKRKKFRYTFMDIESINERRAKYLIGRLFIPRSHR